MTTVTAAGALAFALLCLWRLASRGGTRNGLLVVAAFFVYFSFGPVLNILLGNPVYPGTVLEQVDRASIGFALALLGIVVGDHLAPQRETFDVATVVRGNRIYLMLPLVYATLAAYGTFIISFRFGLLLSGGKAAQLAAAGPFHYQYLLLQLAAVSTFFLSRQTRLQRAAWSLNAAIYVVYCLLTSERDFFFVLVAILVHREVLKSKRRSVRVATSGALSVIVASALFAGRSEGSLTVASVLNQGSILFVDTFVMRYVPAILPHQLGGTYLDALLRFAPGFSGSTPSLSDWLARTYAPAGQSGYGFSLTGEAYLNFGLAGIAVVSLVVTLAHRYAINRADRSDWWAFFSVYTTAVWMYVLRGDSTQLIGSLLYGSMFFAAIHVFSVSINGPSGRALRSADVGKSTAQTPKALSPTRIRE